MSSRILLVNPKFPHNVGAAIRACSIFGADTLRWTGDRVADPASEAGGRIPREERMKEYKRVEFCRHANLSTAVDELAMDGFTPICVEVTENAEELHTFIHPENAVYVFGPEDGSLHRGIKNTCHRFVTIPSRSCLNLGACVNVVLYDRCAKMGFPND